MVEDEQRLSNIIKKGLLEEGYAVDVAYDGEEGQYLAESEEYDLIILDIMLPKMDGLEILRQLRDKHPEKPNGPIVLLTNLGQDSIIKEGFNLGASGYLIKSAMNPDQVLSEVKVFLSKGSLPK